MASYKNNVYDCVCHIIMYVTGLIMGHRVDNGSHVLNWMTYRPIGSDKVTYNMIRI